MVSQEVSDALSGYPHNAVTPVGMAAPVPDHKPSKKERRDLQRFRRNHEGEL